MANVLIIDSEPAVAQALKDALASRGVGSHLTADGTDGLDYVKSNKPDLIVLCVELTRGSGYSVCNKLKKDGAMASIPLILTSSQATEETFEQHKKLRTRAEAYIKKPYTTDLIMQTIGQYVKLGSAGSAASDEVEVSVDDLEVEIPHSAPAPAARRAAAAPADDEEFLDVNFDGEEKEAAPAKREADIRKPAELFSSGPAADVPEPRAASPAPSVSSVAPSDPGRRQGSPQSDAELERLRTEVKQLRARVQKLEQEAQEKEVAFNDRLLAESARARDALEAKKKLTMVEREIAKYQQQTQKAQADAEAAQQQMRDMQTQQEGLGAERGELTDKIAQLADKLREVAAERDSLKREVADLHDAKKSAGSAVETADKMREKAKKAVDIAMQLLEETRLAH